MDQPSIHDPSNLKSFALKPSTALGRFAFFGNGSFGYEFKV